MDMEPAFVTRGSAPALHALCPAVQSFCPSAHHKADILAWATSQKVAAPHYTQVKESYSEAPRFRWQRSVRGAAVATVCGSTIKAWQAVQTCFHETLPTHVEEWKPFQMKVLAFIDFTPVQIEVEMSLAPDNLACAESAQLIVRPGEDYDAIRFHQFVRLLEMRLDDTSSANNVEEDEEDVEQNEFDFDMDVEDVGMVEESVSLLCESASTTTGAVRQEALRLLANWSKGASERTTVALVLSRHAALLAKLLDANKSDLSLAELYSLATAFRWSVSCDTGRELLAKVPVVQENMSRVRRGHGDVHPQLPHIVRQVLERAILALK
mmetsp:Transcript_43581/g.100436  ORF Transcript_43581/g.100436 Transcript_43581/m.100436 type:complete len:324 (+) Transcript_43581:95-1066(+)